MRDIAKRHRFILEQLKKEGFVKVQDLSVRLGVSEVTIRKDLKELEKRKMLYRSHGSASSIKSIVTDKQHIDEKEKIQIEEKIQIAKAANKLLESNDKVIIASGTTLLAFASEIDLNKQVTVITSSIRISMALCYKPNVEIVQLGGIMRKQAVSVVGHYAEDALKNLTCDKLFLGVDGIDINYGLTTSDMSEARLIQQMIEASERVIVLADSSKFGKKGFCKICGIDKVHHIVTDSDARAGIVDQMLEKGIKVTLV